VFDRFQPERQEYSALAGPHWGGSGERREAGLAKTVIAQRQILSLQPLSISRFDGLYPKKRAKA